MPIDRDNSGTISRNTKKADDRHPDIRGQCVVDGRAYWIAGWRRENERGVFYSLAFTPKDDPPAITPPTPAKSAYRAKSMREMPNDDIPF